MSGYYIKEGIEYYNDMSRKKNPFWIGWKIIDYYKLKKGNFKEAYDKCRDLSFLYHKYKNKKI